MHKFKFSSAYKRLIVLAIILTPIFSISEVLALIGGTINSQTEALTSVYIKGLKDLILLAVVVLGTSEAFIRKRIVANKFYWAFMALVACSAFLSLPYKEPLIIAAGMRWILPLVIFPFIYRAVDADLQTKIAKWMIRLFFFAFSLQLAQLFLINGWWGVTVFGLNKRNPGFYLIPSSMACFSCMTVYYSCFYCRRALLRRGIVFVLGPLSILLTASATGLITMVLFWMYLLYSRVKQKALVVMGVSTLFVGLLILLPLLTGRSDIYTSLAIRGEILSDVVKLNNLLLSTNFGDATNTGILLTSQDASTDTTSFITDSIVSSIIFNTGLLSFLVFALFLYRSLRKKALALPRVDTAFFIIFGPFLMTTILFELFPANLLLMVNLAFFYHQSNHHGCESVPRPALLTIVGEPCRS